MCGLIGGFIAHYMIGPRNSSFVPGLAWTKFFLIILPSKHWFWKYEPLSHGTFYNKQLPPAGGSSRVSLCEATYGRRTPVKQQ